MWRQMKILKIPVEVIKKSISDMADKMASATFPSHSVLNQIHHDAAKLVTILRDPEGAPCRFTAILW